MLKIFRVTLLILLASCLIGQQIANAFSQNDLNDIITHHPYYDESATDCSIAGNANTSGGPVWPFATKADSQYQRVDQGWDIQSTPGDSVYAISAGTIHQYAPNAGGFGNDYPTEELDSSIGGPNNWVYYGHVHVLPAVINKHVDAGELIATTNTTNGFSDNGLLENGSVAPPGWLEIGFAQPGTDAPTQPGAEGTATADGQTMKDILIKANPNATIKADGTVFEPGSVKTNDINYHDSSRGNRAIGVTVYQPSDAFSHPLILFAPGRNQDSRASGFYNRYLKAVASSGFIVAGANFSDNNSYESISNDVIDMQFLSTVLQKDTSLKSSVDFGNGIGLIGHSDGAMIALIDGYSNGQRDASIKAVLAADGALYKNTVYATGPPLMLMHGTNDTIEPIASSDAIFGSTNSPGPVNPSYIAYEKFIGADHFQYITAVSPQYNPAVDTTTSAFFKRMLGGDKSDSTSLSKVVASQFSSVVTLLERGSDVSSSPATLKNNTTVVSAGAAACCPSGANSGSSNLVGSDNAEKAYNYFVSKGFTAFQSAGILGNFQAESGMNPKSLEPNTTGDAPIVGRGYGLAQWTPIDRQQGLIDLAAKENKPVFDLGVQLDYVMVEIGPGGNHAGVTAALKATISVDGAVQVWENIFETHNGPPQPERVQFANDFLTKYGSNNSATDTANTTSINTESGCQSQGGSGTLVQGNVKDLAQQILNNQNITYDPSVDVKQQLTDLATNGTTVSCNINTYQVPPMLLGLILGLAQNHKIQISSLVRPGDGCGGPHGAACAVDIDYFDGKGTNGSDAVALELVKDILTIIPTSQKLGFGVGNGLGNPPGITTDQLGATSRPVETFGDNPNHVHTDLRCMGNRG
ncbi:MAG: hypothetical protein NVSMB46_08640 [Candidatus Saccharimonadales bacterium]